MNQSPYDVLGVPMTATDDQIKAAYRKLAKKFHPDLNGGNPVAEAKMQEINEAYNLLIKHKGEPQQQPGGGYGPGNPFYGSGGQQYTYRSMGGAQFFNFEEFLRRMQQSRQYTANTAYAETDPLYKRVEDAYNRREFLQARQMLAQINNRTGAWYYWSAMVDLAQGNRVSALNNARIAVQMDSSRVEYQALYQQLQSGGQAYRQTGTMQGFMGGICNNPCLTCLAANVLFSCCCRGFCC